VAESSEVHFATLVYKNTNIFLARATNPAAFLAQFDAGSQKIDPAHHLQKGSRVTEHCI
jgi:hypothetical protein